MFIVCLQYAVISATIHVPKEKPTLEDALKASTPGDTIILAPGKYMQAKPVEIDKPVTIASQFIYTGDRKTIDNTIIAPASETMHEWFILSADSVNIIGLKFYGNENHTLNNTAAYARIAYCKFINGKDQLSFSGGGGYIGYCYFENAGDDAIDCDQSIDWIIEHNIIINAYQDGIEIRLHKKNGPLTTHIFRNNTVIGSGESGIQLIDYNGNSYRRFFIHNNVFQSCLGAGVSCMYKEKDNTQEVYKGSLMEELAYVYNNTFVNCNYGLTLSPGLLILNNIFTGCLTKAIEEGAYIDSLNKRYMVDYSLFFNNKCHYNNDIRKGNHNLIDIDPMLDGSFRLTSGSPCIDRGTAYYVWNDKEFKIESDEFTGKNPDLGAYEFGGADTVLSFPVVFAGRDTILVHPQNQIQLRGVLKNRVLTNLLHFRWSKISGPGTVTFSHPSQLHTKASFSKQGVYRLKLTGSNGKYSVSDDITIYYVKDFNNRMVSVGKNKDIFVEAEDYRYLMGSADVVFDPDGIVLLSGEGESCSEYSVSTTNEGDIFVWVRYRVKEETNGFRVMFNNKMADNIDLSPLGEGPNGYRWQKLKFAHIPEGIYPLRIRTEHGGIVWDKLLITCDGQKTPEMASDKLSRIEKY